MNTSTRNESQVVEAIRGLPRSLRPSRDLWPDISARLTDRSAEPRVRTPAFSWRHQALAASLVIAFAAGILLGRQLGQDQPASHSPEGANLALMAALQASEKEYQAAFRQFIPVGEARSLLETQAVQNIENSWLDMQQAEVALLAALEEHPENTYLNQRLLDLRAQQLEFMQQLAMLDQFSRRKT